MADVLDIMAHFDPIDRIEGVDLVMPLTEAKRDEAIKYLRYLRDRKG